jgi:hypothetical protein
VVLERSLRVLSVALLALGTGRPPAGLRRRRRWPSGHPRHPVPGGLAQQVLHRPGRAAAGRGRPHRPRCPRRGLPTGVHRGRPDRGRQDHRADAAQPDQRDGRRRVPRDDPAPADHHRGSGGQPAGGRAGERAGDGLPLLRPQLRGARPPGRGGQRTPVGGLPPRAGLRPAGHDRDDQRRDHRTGAFVRPRPGPGPQGHLLAFGVPSPATSSTATWEAPAVSSPPPGTWPTG